MEAILSYKVTYNVSFKAPLFSGYGILEELVGTAGHSVNSIVTTHDAGCIAFPHAGLKRWQISLHKQITISLHA